VDLLTCPGTHLPNRGSPQSSIQLWMIVSLRKLFTGCAGSDRQPMNITLNSFETRIHQLACVGNKFPAAEGLF
jgi:hypothetical protein